MLKDWLHIMYAVVFVEMYIKATSKTPVMYLKRFGIFFPFSMCTFCEVLISVHVRKNCFGTKALTVLLLKVSKFNTSSSLDPD